MYINDVSIIYYLILCLLGLIIGKFIAFCNVKFGKEEKISLKEFFKEKNTIFELQYITMFSIAIVYILLLYKFGIEKNFFKNLDLIKFLVLSPMLVSAFIVDLKHRIIPNRLNMLIFETGIFFVFLYGIDNLAIAKDMALGCFAGAGIFLAITLLGGLIAGKEAMGFGDVKFMGAIGLFYGVSVIAEISLMAFIIAAIFCVGVLIYRYIKKDEDEYLPFGPFLALSAICMMFFPAGIVFRIFMSFCMILSNQILKLI